MPWNIHLARRLIDATLAEALTSSEYEEVRDMLTPAEQRDPFSVEQARLSAEHDAKLYGIGYLIDGKRVHPERVTAICLKREEDER